MHFLGSTLVWFLAAGIVATVPAGLTLSAHAMFAPRCAYPDAASRFGAVCGGLILACAGAMVVAYMAPAFAEVML